MIIQIYPPYFFPLSGSRTSLHLSLYLFGKRSPAEHWGFPYRKPGGYLKKIKLEEDLVIQEKVDSPEFADLERLVFIPHPEQAVPPPELAGVFAQSFVLSSYTSQEVAEKFTHGHNSVIFLKIFEKVFSNTNGNGESVDLHGSSLWMNLDELRCGVHWYISRIEPQDGINIR